MVGEEPFRVRMGQASAHGAPALGPNGPAWCRRQISDLVEPEGEHVVPGVLSSARSMAPLTYGDGTGPEQPIRYSNRTSLTWPRPSASRSSADQLTAGVAWWHSRRSGAAQSYAGQCGIGPSNAATFPDSGS